MAIQTLIYFIATSKKKEIRSSGVPTYHWGSYSKWKKFKSPSAKSSKKVKYSKKAKNKKGKSKYGGTGGVTVHGSKIPATATKTIAGVETTVDVRYYVRGYTIYKRTSALKKDKKMLKKLFTKAYPYQYRLQYKDKVTYETSYSEYKDGKDYLYFGSYYFNDSGIKTYTTGHLPHPVDLQFQYLDIRKNFESNANNSESRDNKGKYVMRNVRSNVMSMTLTWAGLDKDEGADLIDTLNPDAGKNYLIVQYRDPATGKYKNGTFFASERNVTQYANGIFKEITVTLTEV